MHEGAEAEAADDDYVAFFAAGEHAVGEFRCSECGYGVSVYRALPRCPMCRGSAWEPSPGRVLQ
jgi:rubrerythrin